MNHLHLIFLGFFAAVYDHSVIFSSYIFLLCDVEKDYFNRCGKDAFAHLQRAKHFD